jgi:hypothetical protein
MPRLAFFTYGTLHQEHGHPSNDSFHEQGYLVYEQAAAHPGYLWSSEDDWDAYPWWKCSDGMTGAQTLTLWCGLDAVYRFAYRHAHAVALKRRKEWFISHDHPIYVAWWVDDAHYPTWREGVERIEMLDACGPSPSAFSFKQPFTADGQPAPRPTMALDGSLA